MKKLIGLSLAICLMVTMVSGFGAFAAFTPTELDFDGMTLNVTATSETAAADLLAATGWTLNTISGDASVSVVAATDENAAWTGRGDVLKLSGTQSTSKLKINIPADYSYSSDKLCIEYDVFIPSESTNTGKLSLFARHPFGSFNTAVTSGTTYLTYSEYTVRGITDEGVVTAAAGGIFTTEPTGSWQHYKYIFDPQDAVNGTFSLPTTNGGTDHRNVSNMPTLSVYRTVGSTDTLVVRRPVESTFYPYNGNVILGGDPNSGVITRTYYLDNVNIYKVDKFAFASSADDQATGYEIDKPYVEFTMSKAVAPASVAGVTVSGVAGATAAVQADGKTVRVTFNEDLVYATTYTVDFSGVTDVNGQVIESAKKTITFSTKAAPDLYFTGKTLYKGVGAYAAPVAIIAADDIYTIEATIKNTAVSSSQATVICAIYDAYGRLVDTVFVGKTVADEEKIGTGLTVPASAAGGEVKVFLWKDMTSMQAYVKPLVVDIAQ